MSGRGRSSSTTKIFVGSLPAGSNAQDLRRLFEPYGQIAECDISNRCGFLHMENHDLAMKAIAELNGTDFMGAVITVEKGRVKPRRNEGGPDRSRPMRGKNPGPYSRGGPPQRNGGGYGSRDFSPYGGGGDRFGGPGGDRFGGERFAAPERFGGPPDRFRGGGFDDRMPPRGGGGYGGFDGPVNDRRDAGNFGNDRRGGYAERQPPSLFDLPQQRRPLLNDRRPPLIESGNLGVPRGGNRGGPVDTFSRRDEGMNNRAGYNNNISPSNGFNNNGYNGGLSGGGGLQGYSGGGGVGGSSGGNYNNNRYGGSPGAGYGGSPGGGGGSNYGGGGGARRTGGGNFGNSYGGGGRNYDSSYPSLPPQRGFASGGGPGGPRRDMAPGRRF